MGNSMLALLAVGCVSVSTALLPRAPETRAAEGPCNICKPELDDNDVTCQTGAMIVHAVPTSAQCEEDLGICFYATGTCSGKVTVPVPFPPGAGCVSLGGAAGAPGATCVNLPGAPANAVNVTLELSGKCGDAVYKEIYYYAGPCPAPAGAAPICGGTIAFRCPKCTEFP